MNTDKERADAAEDGLFRVVQALGFDMDGAKTASEFFGPMTYCTEDARYTEPADIAVAYAIDHRKEMEEEADQYEAKILWLTKRADKAWAVINSDHWRNRYDEDMARGNAYVATLRGRLRAVLAALKEKNE
jgi:hypothetical protein